MKTFTDLGMEIGALVEQKNAAYGSSFAVAGDFLRLLFPEGIPADRFDDAPLMVRIFDKQMRIATDKDAFGESPYQDIAGYGILGLHLHQRKKESKTWPGSASSPNASGSSKAQPDSAAQPTGGWTTTSASATAASEPSLPHFASFGKPISAPVPTAMEVASANAGALRRLRRNGRGRCAGCGVNEIPGSSRVAAFYPDGLTFQYCSFDCVNSDRYEVQG